MNLSPICHCCFHVYFFVVVMFSMCNCVRTKVGVLTGMGVWPVGVFMLFVASSSSSSPSPFWSFCRGRRYTTMPSPISSPSPPRTTTTTHWMIMVLLFCSVSLFLFGFLCQSQFGRIHTPTTTPTIMIIIYYDLSYYYIFHWIKLNNIYYDHTTTTTSIEPMEDDLKGLNYTLFAFNLGPLLAAFFGYAPWWP